MKREQIRSERRRRPTGKNAAMETAAATRQVDALALRAQGLGYRGIARRLGI